MAGSVGLAGSKCSRCEVQRPKDAFPLSKSGIKSSFEETKTWTLGKNIQG